MASHNCKREKVFTLQFCIEINIPFTGLLFRISSASIYSLSPSGHIWSLTLVSDSLHIFEDKKIYFYERLVGSKPFLAGNVVYVQTVTVHIAILTFFQFNCSLTSLVVFLHFATLLTVLVYCSFKGKIKVSSALCMSSRCFWILSSMHFILVFHFVVTQMTCWIRGCTWPILAIWSEHKLYVCFVLRIFEVVEIEVNDSVTMHSIKLL